MLRAPHGTTAAISARNTSRFVRFFFPAKSSDAKLSWSIGKPLESMVPVCHDRGLFRGSLDLRCIFGELLANDGGHQEFLSN